MKANRWLIMSSAQTKQLAFLLGQHHPNDATKGQIAIAKPTHITFHSGTYTPRAAQGYTSLLSRSPGSQANVSLLCHQGGWPRPPVTPPWEHRARLWDFEKLLLPAKNSQQPRCHQSPEARVAGRVGWGQAKPTNSSFKV